MKIEIFAGLPGVIVSILGQSQTYRQYFDGAETFTLNSVLPRSPSKTIGSIVRGYKIGVTKWFRANMGDQFPIGHSVWQRNYYDHIIRDESSYKKISEYIINNPKKWKGDKFYE